MTNVKFTDPATAPDGTIECYYYLDGIFTGRIHYKNGAWRIPNRDEDSPLDSFPTLEAAQYYIRGKVAGGDAMRALIVRWLKRNPGKVEE